MKISYNWLKDYINLPLPVEEVADILTSTGLEVEEVTKQESIKGGMEGLVIGIVKSVGKHPDADKLNITQTNVGGDTDLQIVCGAPNVAVGQKVIVALEGVTVHPTEGEEFKIKKSKIRGAISEGMLCSAAEIGLSTDHSGLTILDESAEVGKPVKDYFKIESDYVLEIGLTPNRSDAFSHIGVARDLAAYLTAKKNIKSPVCIPPAELPATATGASPIMVNVENTTACPRYMGIYISNVKVGESPKWLKERLNSIGIRSINNIVDATNFVLNECGQPLHAFDADKIEGKKVIVRNLPEGDPFITLDEKEIKLSSKDLMICDTVTGMCIAGVYGGLHSGVTHETKNIFLESAAFHPGTIRQTATRHNLRTDAAIHFEKGIDPNLPAYALKRAALLIAEIAGGQLNHAVVDVNNSKPVERTIALSYQRLQNIAGITIKPAEIKNILSALQFTIVKEDENGVAWKVPSYKIDLERDVDLAEEVLRIYGYDNIPLPSELRSSLSYSRPEDGDRQLFEKISNYLADNGFAEIMNNSIANSKAVLDNDANAGEHLLRFMNYANAGLDSMRNNLLYAGLEVILHNKNRKAGDLNLFEAGKVYSREGEKITESSRLALFLHGKSQGENWKAKQTDADFYELKAYVQNVLKLCGVKKVTSTPINDGEYAFGLELTQGKEVIGRLGLIGEKLLKYFDVKSLVYFSELYLDNLLPAARTLAVRFKELSKFQAVRRDLALVIDEAVKYEQIEKAAKQAAGNALTAVNLFDVYQDEKLGKGKKSYAVSFTFIDEEKTLTDVEIDNLMRKVTEALEKNTQAVIRQ